MKPEHPASATGAVKQTFQNRSDRLGLLNTEYKSWPWRSLSPGGKESWHLVCPPDQWNL